MPLERAHTFTYPVGNAGNAWKLGKNLHPDVTRSHRIDRLPFGLSLQPFFHQPQPEPGYSSHT